MEWENQLVVKAIVGYIRTFYFSVGVYFGFFFSFYLFLFIFGAWDSFLILSYCICIGQNQSSVFIVQCTDCVSCIIALHNFRYFSSCCCCYYFFLLPFAFRLPFTLYLRFVFISVTWFSKYNYTVDTRKFVSVSLQRCMFFVCRSSFVRFSFLCKEQSFGGYFRFSVRFARGFVSVYIYFIATHFL